MKIYTIAGMVLLAVGCASVNEGPETRPKGESVVSKEALKEAKRSVDFERHVKPIFEARCMYCHDGREMPGKFDLSKRSTAMASGTSGPRIVPGNADASLLISFISTGNHAKSMPTVGTQVTPEEVEVLRNWINAGAKWTE
jgi:uncharacterized membrane protein